MTPELLKLATTVHKVPQYYRLFWTEARTGRDLDAATHWVWLWMPDADDDGTEFTKSAIRSLLRSMRDGSWFTHFPVNPLPR